MDPEPVKAATSKDLSHANGRMMARSEAAEAEVPGIADAGSSPYLCDLTVSGARQMTIGQSMRRTAFGLSVSPKPMCPAR